MMIKENVTYEEAEVELKRFSESILDLISQRQKTIENIERLQAELDELNKEIRSHYPPIPKPEVQGKKKQATKSPSKGTRPRKKGKFLRDWIVEVLQENKGGLTASQVAIKVVDKGFKTESKRFRDVVYDAMHSDSRFKRTSTGPGSRDVLWVLAKK